MKYLFVIILFFCALYGCGEKVSQPIIDYSTDYEVNKRMLSVSRMLKKQAEQTLVLINNKESDMKKVKKLSEKNKIKSVKVIKDSAEIESLNYPYKRIRTIIVVTKE